MKARTTLTVFADGDCDGSASAPLDLPRGRAAPWKWKRQSSSSDLNDLETASGRRRIGRPTPALLVAVCLALSSSLRPPRADAAAAASPVPVSAIASRPYPLKNKKRRRNNTGFYYGIRDDDITSRSPPPSPPSLSLSDPNPTAGISAMLRGAASLARVAAAGAWPVHDSPIPGERATPAGPAMRRWEEGHCAGVSGTSSSTIYTLEETHRHRQRRLVKASSATKQRRRRRRNNTGFYYGIRDDVLVMPPPSLPYNGAGEKGKSMDHPAPVMDGVSAPEIKGEAGVREKKRLSAPLSSPNKGLRDNDAFESNGGTMTKKQKREQYQQKQNQQKQLANDKKAKPRKKKSSEVPAGISEVLSETMIELREMREEIVALRGELRMLKDGWQRKQQQQEEQQLSRREENKGGDESLNEKNQQQMQGRARSKDHVFEDGGMSPDMKHDPSIPTLGTLDGAERRRRLERIGKDVERWADTMLSEGDEEDMDVDKDGWKEISCNNFVKRKFNRDGRTKVYLKWIPDSRDERDIEETSSTTQLYPCLRCHSTIDAPLEDVCSFLANEETIPLYNDLVTDHADVEEITPHSKITWCQAPKILFVKPRDFVTYCSHRWREDGAQVLVNQACEHNDRPATLVEGQGVVCRGFALRGANFISMDPDDSSKTRITMLSHANPGGGLPQWAVNTAVNAVVQIEPFKFFHNINDSIRNYEPTRAWSGNSQASNVGNDPMGRSDKPAGIAHLGFTCFWPNGGGLSENSAGFAPNPRRQTLWDDVEGEDNLLPG